MKAALTVQCPRCGAEPGEWCRLRLNKDKTLTKRRLCKKRAAALTRSTQ